MLHTNLSTRPFYNVRAVRAAIGALAVIVIAVSVYNVYRIVRLTITQSTVGASASDAEREAGQLREQAAAIRAQINPRELGTVSAAAREANGIIDQRAFSWTGLFSQFEATLPPDVRIREIQPSLERDGSFRVGMQVEARRIEDIDAFIEALEGKSTFRDVVPLATETNDEGLLVSAIEGIYVPGAQP